MLLQQANQFFLERSLPVVLPLVADVLHHSGQDGRGDGEALVSILPREGTHSREGIVNPAGGVRLDLAYEVRDRNRRRNDNSEMQVVGDTVPDHQLPFEISSYPSDVLDSPGQGDIIQERASILGREHDVVEVT